MLKIRGCAANGARCYQRRGVYIIFAGFMGLLLVLGIRTAYIMLVESQYYTEKADDQHERERSIKAARGKIYDRNGVVLADNKTVCTVSVVYNQVEDREAVIKMLCEELSLDEETVRKKVEKKSSREIIKTNVDKEIGDRIRTWDYAGVKVDEDYKRYYPYGTLASKVLGFTGADNQGIIGLEVSYDDILQGTNGKILTVTTARGVELNGVAEERVEPIAGQNLYTSLDWNIQMFAEQEAMRVYTQKQAKKVQVLVMNPQNGEIYACVNYPEFDLNNPFSLSASQEEITQKEGESLLDSLNGMWRNGVVNDTYEPGSTFKIITAAAGLETGEVTLDSHFTCPGFYIVEDRRIRCHKIAGHGSETFLDGIKNSCNPVFMQVGLRVGAQRYYQYFQKFGLLGKTGIDVPGEAVGIMHQESAIGEVELATMSFGQSFQITPLRLATTVSALINGGNMIVPHFGVYIEDTQTHSYQALTYEAETGIVSEETSEILRYALEKVVSEGGGINAYIEGYQIGGKTATSEKLPRGANTYISSFIGFAPADDPQVLVLMTVDEPQGIYYGGTIVAPAVANIMDNILPYLGIEKTVGGNE